MVFAARTYRRAEEVQSDGAVADGAGAVGAYLAGVGPVLQVCAGGARMLTTNDLLGSPVEATWSSGIGEQEAFKDRDGMGSVCAVGALADLLARIGPDHIVDRNGLAVRFRQSAGFQRIIWAVADALERAIAEQPWESSVDGAGGGRGLGRSHGLPADDGCPMRTEN